MGDGWGSKKLKSCKDLVFGILVVERNKITVSLPPDSKNHNVGNVSSLYTVSSQQITIFES